MSIGSRLKQARLAQGQTQEELAKAVGVTKGAIGNYETGVSSPKESILIKLMDELEVDANFLYQDYVQFETAKGNISSISETLKADEATLLQAYRSLNSEGKKLAIQTIQGFAGNPGMVQEEQQRSGT